MIVRIGHAAMDANGKATGGSAGDEICTRAWYNYSSPWKTVFRPSNPEIAEIIAQTMEDACENRNIGYSREDRLSLMAAALETKFNLKKINKECNCDNTSLIAVCISAANLIIPAGMSIENEEKFLLRTGKFSTLTSEKYLSSYKYLKRGDILLADGHSVIVLDNGPEAEGTAYEERQKQISKNSKYNGKEIEEIVSTEPFDIKSGSAERFITLQTLPKGSSIKVLEKLSNGWFKIIYSKSFAGYAYVDAKHFI